MAGSIAQGVGVVLFGLVDRIQDLSQFIGASIALRILEGVGLGSAFVGVYSLLPSLFPKEHLNFIMVRLD